MAEMKIRNTGPLRITVTDDRGRLVAALRYPRVKWKDLVIESDDADFEVVSLGDRRARLVRLGPRAAGEEGGADPGERPDRDPFRQVEFGLRDLLTKAGRAVDDFLADLNEWSGPVKSGPARSGPTRSDSPDDD